jgi:hypothetical protein
VAGDVGLAQVRGDEEFVQVDGEGVVAITGVQAGTT